MGIHCFLDGSRGCLFEPFIAEIMHSVLGFLLQRLDSRLQFVDVLLKFGFVGHFRQCQKRKEGSWMERIIGKCEVSEGNLRWELGLRMGNFVKV